LRRLRLEAQEAVANTPTAPLGRQLQVWRHGFYGRHALLYDFDEHDFDAYVSDFQRATKLGGLNDGRYVLDDKLVSFLYLGAVAAPTPTVYAFGNGARTFFLEDAPEPKSIEGLCRTGESSSSNPEGLGWRPLLLGRAQGGHNHGERSGHRQPPRLLQRERRRLRVRRAA
jgi:hypothetical protein